MDDPRTAEHVALLGDSIFDNAAYTRGEPSVVEHLGTLLPIGWTATLCAVDGTTASGVAAQLPRVPPDATRLVVAAGGNDALGHVDLLRLPVRSSAETLAAFAARLESFERDYREMLRGVTALGLPVAVCTIYNGNLAPGEAELARVALATFNDVIMRAAFAARADVIELRAICHHPADYANPIEPSGQGGRKIALAIARAVSAKVDPGGPSRVWSG